MKSLIQMLGGRIVGTVEEVSADRIVVLLDLDAPQATALNTGVPTAFPRINGHVLIPNESGATACIISSVRIERLPIPKRSGMQRDFSLVDLPFPSRVMSLTPIGTLRALPTPEGLSFGVRRGVDMFPSVGDQVLLPGMEQLRAIVEGEDDATKRIHIGHCPTAGRAPVHVDPDKLFGRHLAVLGNTGAGKSCSVAGLVRWSLDSAKKARVEIERSFRPNARFILLDPNGEYAQAFQDLPVRLFRVDPGTEGQPLRVPAWLWNGAEWAAFTGAAPGVQRPVLFDALRRLRSELGPPDEYETKAKGRIRRYQIRIKALIENSEYHGPGRREGAAVVLENITEDFSELAQDTRCMDSNLKSHLEVISDEARRIEERRRSRKKQEGDGYWHEDFSETELDVISDALQSAADVAGLREDAGEKEEDTPMPFVVSELPDYVAALAADRSGRDIAQFVDTLNLRIRGLLAGTRLSSILQADDTSITLEGWLTDHIGADQAQNGPIAVVDLSLVPSEVIHIVVSVLARMVFEALQRYRRVHGNELGAALLRRRGGGHRRGGETCTTHGYGVDSALRWGLRTASSDFLT